MALKSYLKSYRQPLVLILMVIFTVGIYSPVSVQGADKVEKKKKRPPIYDPGLDVKASITNSLAQAKKENKHLLLMFGANWCPWCHLLHGFFKSNQATAKFLAENYIIVMIDIGEKTEEPLNRDLVSLYRVNGFGYPSLAVLDQSGKLLSSQNSGILEKGRGYDPERVMGFLKAQAPMKK
ncbi:MAG: thioredoxin family protein [bacterium]|nr:thioredoxin family protein [bacterium]